MTDTPIETQFVVHVSLRAIDGEATTIVWEYSRVNTRMAEAFAEVSELMNSVAILTRVNDNDLNYDILRSSAAIVYAIQRDNPPQTIIALYSTLLTATKECDRINAQWDQPICSVLPMPFNIR